MRIDFRCLVLKYAKPVLILAMLLLLGMSLRTGDLYAAASTPEPSSGLQPHAEHGMIDFSGWSFRDSGIAHLDGNWAVYWQQLLEPNHFHSIGTAALPEFYGKVPSTWGSYQMNGASLSNQGYATYRLLIRMNPADAGDVKSLYIRNAASAYKLWIDGRLLASNGVVGKNLEEMKPKNYAKIVDFVPAGTEVELVVQVSNFVQRKGGLWDGILIGSNDQIKSLREKRMVLQLAIATCLFITGLYHLLLYAQRRRDKSTLYFGGVGIAISLRTLVVGDTLLVSYFPSISWEAAVKVEYLGFIVALPLMVAYVHTLYPRELARFYRNISTWIGLVCSVFVLAAPARIYTHFMLPYQIFILVSFTYIVIASLLALLRKREGAGLNGFALLCILLAAINDTLYYNNVISTGDSFPYGLLIALLIQSYMLSVRFSNSFKQVERLSGELLHLNESLEEKIRERTASLQAANDEMLHMEQSRRQLLSNISHELGTPLTSIQGYVKGMLDDVFPASSVYLQRVYEKTRLLDRIVDDLHDLSRLEAGQLRFSYRRVEVTSFIRRLYDKYEYEMQKSGIRFQYHEAELPSTGLTAVFHVDPTRIEQVTANLLFNAFKFTPSGGLIRLEMSFEPAEFADSLPDRVTVTVADTGQGIPEKDLPHVFERYYKADNQRIAQEQGAGLGLAISKEIIDGHQGKISVRSVFGQGSALAFSLPVEWVPVTQLTEEQEL